MGYVQFKAGKIIEQKNFGPYKVTLRFPRMKDVYQYMALANALVAERARIGLTKKVSLKEERARMKDRFRRAKKGMLIPLCIEANNKIIGAASLFREVPPPSAFEHTAKFVIQLLKEYRGLGIATHAAKTLFDLGKKMWGLRLIRSSYAADNIASAALHRKLGFKFVGKIPKGLKYGQKYVDEIIVLKKL